MFGTISERFIPSSDQQIALELGVVIKEDLETPPETKTINYERTNKKQAEEPVKGHGRGKMPTHLPIEEKVIEPEDDIK